MQTKQFIYGYFKAIQLIIVLLFVSTMVSGQTRSSKRGIAYGYHTEADMAIVSKGLSWWYNWYYQPESMVSATYSNYNMDFVPMAWGKSFDETGMRAYYASHPNVKYLLGFNEPNFLSQANMKPSEAAAAWPKLEKIAKDCGLKIVGPAVNYSGDPVQENGVSYSNPFTYLDAFFAACPNCQVDYIAVHNYMCYSGALSDYINQFKKYGKPIWLTEFACWDQQNITLYMQKGLVLGALDYLESEPMVFRYAWFNGNRTGGYPYLNLYDSQSGKLTELGQLYVNYNPMHDPNYYTPIPARIEAENYSSMSGISLEATSDVSGIANVGWIDAGDWLEYNLDVPSSDNYTFYFRISANAATSFELRENGTTLKTVQVASSGGWQNWNTIQTSLQLTSGKHKIQVYTPKGMFNLNWLELTQNGQTTLIDQPSLEGMRVYPNPVTEKLFVETGDKDGKTSISVFDISGQTIFTKTYSELEPLKEIDFSSFKNGTYVVRIQNNNKTHNQLVIK